MVAPHPTRDDHRYMRTESDIETLTSRLIDRFPGATDARYVCYRIAGTDEASDIARNVERAVFESTFAGNDAQFMAREYGPYEDASLFFLSVDRMRRRPIGALRVTRNSPAGFKTINDLASGRLPVHLAEEEVSTRHRIQSWDACWDVATLAVSEDYRRTAARAALQLYRGMYVTALEHGIEHLIAIIDKTPLLAMTDYLSIPFTPICGSGYFSYLESAKSRAVHGYVPDFYPVITGRLAEVHKDPVATAALSYIILGTDDHVLLFGEAP